MAVIKREIVDVLQEISTRLQQIETRCGRIETIIVEQGGQISEIHAKAIDESDRAGTRVNNHSTRLGVIERILRIDPASRL